MTNSRGLVNGRHYTDYVGTIKELKRNNQYPEAISILLQCADAVEEEATANRWGLAPWYYEQLAIIYRKQKDPVNEIKILERFAKQKHNFLYAPKLIERLEKLKTNMDSDIRLPK